MKKSHLIFAPKLVNEEHQHSAVNSFSCSSQSNIESCKIHDHSCKQLQFVENAERVFSDALKQIKSQDSEHDCQTCSGSCGEHALSFSVFFPRTSPSLTCVRGNNPNRFGHSRNRLQAPFRHANCYFSPLSDFSCPGDTSHNYSKLTIASQAVR